MDKDGTTEPQIKVVAERVKLELIYHDPEIYPRKRGFDPRRVERYAACMRDGEGFDPIEVEADGDKYRLLDGLHRLKALREIGMAEADVLIVNLDGRSPLLYAARRNRFGKDLTDDDAEDVARRAFLDNPRVTNREIALAVGRSESTVSGYLSDLRARHELAQDLKIFKMGLLGIPQERTMVFGKNPFARSSFGKSFNSEVLTKCLATVSRSIPSLMAMEKLGWPEPLVWAVALEGKDDRERFAELRWNIRVWDYWNWGDVDPPGRWTSGSR